MKRSLPQHRSQFQITSISRQQSLSGNSTNTKESKESRFKIVKTDSDKKNDQNQSNSTLSNQQLNSASNKNDANLNQTPSMPSRQNFNGESGQNGKSYHRGRWHVMDFENATPDTKKQQYTVPVALQQNSYNSNNSAKNSANLAKQNLGQTTPKMTNLRNNINFGSIEAKNDDSANYQSKLNNNK